MKQFAPELSQWSSENRHVILIQIWKGSLELLKSEEVRA